MTEIGLTRRSLMTAAPALLFAGKARAALPYEVKTVWGGFDGTHHLGGLHILMQPGWKTYWRVPGAGGIPPSIEGLGDNLAELRFDCPLPQRIAGEDGESIGYKTEVVFPFSLTPRDPAALVNVNLRAFVGVCDTICIPVPFTQSIELQPLAMATRDAALLAQWRAKVPVPQVSGPALSATAGAENGKLYVDLALSAAVDDIFVEGHVMQTFTEPTFSADHLTARMFVHGAKSMADIHGTSLRLTFNQKGQGLEQRLMVS